MGKPLNLLEVHVFDGVKEDGTVVFNVWTDIKDRPFRFFAIPRKGDVFILDDIYYEVLVVEFFASPKYVDYPTFFCQGKLFVKQIGDKEKYKIVLIDAINNSSF